MRSHKQFFYALVIAFSLIGNVSADTCYDPRYGDYDCNPGYSSYPDQGGALMEGLFIGAILGGAFNNGNGNYHGNGHGNGNHYQGNGNGNHYQGNGNYGGGGHGHH